MKIKAALAISGIFSMGASTFMLAPAFADDPAPQSKSDIQKNGSSTSPPEEEIVGVKPIQAGPPSQSSGEVDSGNSPAMGLGIQFNLSKPKRAVTPEPEPSPQN
jgi:hypothetical protein